MQYSVGFVDEGLFVGGYVHTSRPKEGPYSSSQLGPGTGNVGAYDNSKGGDVVFALVLLADLLLEFGDCLLSAWVPGSVGAEAPLRVFG